MIDDREAAYWAAEREHDYDEQLRRERAERQRQDELDEVEWHLAVLADNLRIAGALCTAFADGEFSYAHRGCEYDCQFQWRPGCGKQAP